MGFDVSHLADQKDAANERYEAFSDGAPDEKMLGNLTPEEWKRYDEGMRMLDRRIIAEAKLKITVVDNPPEAAHACAA